MSNVAPLADLKAWAREARIYPDAFDCPYYDECNASANHTLLGGSGCMMSYVGRRYGSNGAREGFRLVVVGMDHGEGKSATFEERREGIEGGGELNPHYKGVVRTAAFILGSDGEYCLRTCTDSCQKGRSAAAKRCVIERIAQPNIVKCAPESESRSSRATPKMKQNCAHHLTSELRLLKPQLVVFHGVHARSTMLPVLKNADLDVTEVGNIIDDQDRPVLYESQALDAHILFLYHPSYGWLDSQWETVVVPAVNYLRGRNLVPT